MEPNRLTTFQVARMCGVFHTTVISWVNKGWLRADLTPGGHRRIHPGDLVQMLKERGSPIPAAVTGILTDSDLMDFLEQHGGTTRKGVRKMIAAYTREHGTLLARSRRRRARR